MKLKTVLISLFISFFYSNAQASYEKSVVRISSTLSLYDYKHPWKLAKRKNVVGSGAIIEGQYILTNAHVVSNAKVIEVKKSNDRKRYYAKIKYISHQADLALLEMFDKKFFKNTKPLKISSYAKTGDKVAAAGYPEASIDLTVKKGKIVKLKYQPYSLSDENLLSLELNISIKEGNSGGPVLNSDGEIIGIAMQMPEDSPTTAYAVPSSIINTFLEDIKDKKVEGFHSNANSYQFLANQTLKNYYKTNKNGVLVTGVDMNEKQLKVDDIIFEIDTFKLFGTSEVQFLSKFHKKPVGESITLSILRDSKIIHIDYKLNRYKKLIQHEFNVKPRYFIFGGLVFTPITRNYLQAIGMRQYEMNMLFYEQKRSLELQEPVAWMESKFAHEINKGYNSKAEIVHRVNNIKVKSFNHFIKLIQDSEQKYIVIDFLKKQRVILEKDEAMKSFLKTEKQ